MLVDIKGYEGRYFLNKEGEVYSKNSKKGFLKLAYRIRGGGYYSVVLYDKNKNPKNTNIHRLVATHFINNPDNKKQVNHINGVKTDNRISNLEWVTSKENRQHAVKTGLSKFKKGKESILYGLHGLSHYQSIKVQCLFTGQIMNIKEAAKFIQVHHSSMSKMISGINKNWTNFIKV